MDIVINIDKNRSARRVSGSYLTHNSDIRLVVSADPESGFDVSQPMSAIVVTCRGAYPPVTASGGVFAAPMLTDDDIPTGARIGFVQGTVRATTPASVSVIKTIEDYESVSADPHADEYNRVISEISEEDKFILERASDGYRGAALISALIEYLTEGAEGKSAYELAVEEGYEGTQEEWLASLIGETGAPGADGFSPTASVSKVGTTATITITDKNGTTTATISDGAKGDKGDKGDDHVIIVDYGDETRDLYIGISAAYNAGKAIHLRKDGIIATDFALITGGIVWSAPIGDGIGVNRYTLTSEGAWSFAPELGVRYSQGTAQGGKYLGVSKLSGVVIPYAPDTEPHENSGALITSGAVYGALANKQDTSNLVTSLSATSTDSQYPSAKCVYDAIIGAIEEEY